MTEANEPTDTGAPKATAEQRIREIAHRIWLEEGMPEGHADEHWRRAEQIAANANEEAADDPFPAAPIYRVA